MHVDDDPVARRFVDVGQLDRVGTIEPSHLYRAHATSVVAAIGAVITAPEQRLISLLPDQSPPATRTTARPENLPART